MSSLELEAHPEGVLLLVRAHAGARRNGILGVREGMLRVAVTEAPEKGKANRAISTLLSREFGVSKSAVRTISGETSPRKRFLLAGVTLAEVTLRIESMGLAEG